MRSFFDYDSPLMSGLGKMADLVILNLLTLLCCIPIITIGASMTACHYVALKIKRGEGYVVKNFFKSFKVNLLQSAVIGFLLAFNILLCAYIVLFWRVGGNIAAVVRGVLCVSIIFWIFIAVWVFPIQSKFINSIKATIKNSFIMSFKYLFRTLLMIIIYMIPVAVFLIFQIKGISVLMLFGFSFPIYLCALLYDKIIQEIEDAILEREAEEKAEEGSTVS